MSAEPVEPDVTASPFVVLSGDGLVLRCLWQRDVAALLAGEDDDQVRWLLEGHRSELERTRRWVGETQREWATGGPRRHLGVFDGETGELVGAVEAHLGLGGGGANASYVVFPPWRGRRVAVRAVGLLCGWLADATPTRTAVLRIDPRNAPSRGVARAAGFVLTTRAPEADDDGERLDRYERPLR